MILRPRQKEMVDACLKAASESKTNSTLAVAPTGAGKTCILSGVLGCFDTALVLQHREELVDQNIRTFKAVNPRKKADVFKANRKRFLGVGATFAMVQTLVRNLDSMKRVDVIGIDEGHHAAAESYTKIVERARELNPNVKIIGVTATPSRSDKKALATIFDNVADVIQLAELIQAGFLVRPRTFVIDCGLREELSQVRKTVNDFDMSEVEKIMDKMAVNDRVFEEWQKLAGNRSTVIFCSTVAHAEHVFNHFKERGITAEFIHGNLGVKERKAAFDRFDKAISQVLVNVAVATEGWDCQHVSCVILLRPCSHKSTVLQMIGRGLRKVDPERYPWALKDDCIVIDFGYSLITHGSLDIDIELEPQKRKPKRIPCPFCEAEIPPTVTNCPLCDGLINDRAAVVRSARERGALEEFKLTEIEIIDVSPFKWEDMFENLVLMADAMTAWACIVLVHGRWHAVGWREGAAIVNLANSEDRVMALGSADDFLREHGDTENARKSRSWMALLPTDKQLEILQLPPMAAMSTTRYRAACLLTWKSNEKIIRKKVLPEPTKM